MAQKYFGTGAADPRSVDDLDDNFTELYAFDAALQASASAADGSGLVGHNVAVTYTAGTVGAAINELLGAVTADTVADLRAMTAPAERVQTLGYYSVGDGGAGLYWRDDADTTTADNNGTVIVTGGGVRLKLLVPGPVLHARQCGVRGDGVTGETAMLLAADVMARALRKALLIEGVVLLNAQVWLSAPTHWIFAGHPNHGNTNLGPTGSTVPGAWLKVPATLPSGTGAVVVEHPGIAFTHGAIGCDPSFTWPYDGLVVLANGFRWDKGLVFGMGRDGVVLGTPSGTAGSYNSNSVVLDQIASVWNGRHGINVSDDVGSLDANTFLLISPRVFNNAGTGIRFGKTYLGGTVVTPTVEFNATGMHFTADASGILVLGGDIEANVGPHVGGIEGTGPPQNVVEDAPGQNHFQYVSIQGVVRNDGGGGGSSPLTTKGDLYAYTTTNARLPVGTNGHTLVADSAQATGLKWAAVPDNVVAKDGTTTMTGTLTAPDLLASKTGYPTIQASGTTGGSVSIAAGAVLAGIRTDASIIEMGAISSHDLIILTNGTQRMRITASGQIFMHGLPTASPGISGAVWRDGSNYVRIDP